MTIISSDLDVVSGAAYSTTDSNENIVVQYGVSLVGDVGIESGKDGQGKYYSHTQIVTNGLISAQLAGILLYNDFNNVFNSKGGSIYGQSCVSLSGYDNTVVNDGVMDASVAAVFINGTYNNVSNAGAIKSAENGIQSTGSFLSISNSGIINAVYALRSIKASNTTFRNTGSIVGYVQFGSGANLFDGRGGTLYGTIEGGTSADTVFLGDNGETVQGNGGHDRLYAGAGADTFVFNSIAPGSTDTVHGFDAARDTFQLAHGAFAALMANQTPVFAIGTQATSAADHLFYNAAGGGLFYDADGSGSKAATLVAHLDPGLHLTARNFEVV